MQRAIPLLLLALIACGCLFFRLGSLPLSGADEPRYARIAQEMGDRGTWVTPLLEQRPWMEKPPLYYWLTIPSYSVFKVSETSARLGPALCALIAALAIYWLGSQLWSRQAGFIGSAILLTSIGFIGFGRSASTDMPFTCCLTLFFALEVAGCRSQVPSPRLLDLVAALVSYVFLGLAVLAKGPVALILAAGIMLCAWYLDERGVLVRKWLVLPGIAIAGAVSIPWFWLAFRQNGFSFIATFFINHNLARFTTDIHHHSQPFFYFIPVLLGLVFPWTGWLPLLVSKSPMQALRRWRDWDFRMVFLACWFIFPILFFSLSDSKLPGYVLPSLPPLALILGVFISRPVDQSRLRFAAVLDLIVSLGMVIAIPLAFQKEYGGAWKTGIPLSAAVLIPAIFSVIFKMRGETLKAVGATVVESVLLVVFLAQFAFPVLGAYHSTRDIAYHALELRRPGDQIVTYRFFHHTLHYYTGYQVAGKMDDPHSLVQFARKNSGCLVVTNIKGMKELSGLKDISAIVLAEQGDFRLLRLSLKVAGFKSQVAGP